MAEAATTFGKYLLLKKLASGGMGEVFLAKQSLPGGESRLVVIKRILAHHLEKPDYLDMFFSEARLVARLSHKHIIRIHEMGEIEGDHYIAMEYVWGQSLRDMLDRLRQRNQPMSMAHVVDLGIMLADGLGYAHQACDLEGMPMHIVHRDINPHNVLLSYSGDLKLIDFGIAKSEMAAVRTATGTIKGKFVYMSPEQSAADPIDLRSDIFSLGIVLYEAATLENPFVRQNVVLSLEAIQRQEVSLVSKRREDASPLDLILKRALMKDPNERYQTAFEMRDELMAVRRGLTASAAQTDLGDFLRTLFKSEMAEEARFLDGGRPAPALGMPRQRAAKVDPFDEEPTLHGDESDMAVQSRMMSVVPGRGGSSDDEAVSGASSDDTTNNESQTGPLDEALGSAASAAAEFLHEEETRSERPSDKHSPEPLGAPDDTYEEIPSGAAVEAGEARLDGLGGTVAVAVPPAPSPRMGLWVVLTVLLMAAVGFGLTQLLRDGPSWGAVTPILPMPPDAGAADAGADEPSDPAVADAGAAPAQVSPADAGLAPDAGKTPTVKKTRRRRAGRRSGRRRRSAAARKNTGRSSVAVAADAAVDAGTEPPAEEAAGEASEERVAPGAAESPPEPEAPEAEKAAVGDAEGPAGVLTLTASQRIVARIGGRRVRLPSHVSLQEATGRIRLSGRGLPYRVEMRYTLGPGGVGLRIKAEPWVILRAGGVSRGQTPQTLAPATEHQLELLRPGAPDLQLTLVWTPAQSSP